MPISENGQRAEPGLPFSTPSATMRRTEYNYGGTVATVMQEVITVTGVTPNTGEPGVRRVVYQQRAKVRSTRIQGRLSSTAKTAPSIDGTSPATTPHADRMNLTPGRGEAYTPTAPRADGTVYAINVTPFYLQVRAVMREPNSMRSWISFSTHSSSWPIAGRCPHMPLS